MVWSLRELIKEAMLHVTSADAAYRWLREAGYEYTRAEVRKTWREVGESEYWATVLETYGLERTPPHWWLVEGKAGQKEEYLYLFRVTVFDPETLTTETRYVASLSEKLTSYAEKWEEVGEELAASQAARGYVLIDWAPGGILRKPS